MMTEDPFVLKGYLLASAHQIQKVPSLMMKVYSLDHMFGHAEDRIVDDRGEYIYVDTYQDGLYIVHCTV